MHFLLSRIVAHGLGFQTCGGIEHLLSSWRNWNIGLHKVSTFLCIYIYMFVWRRYYYVSVYKSQNLIWFTFFEATKTKSCGFYVEVDRSVFKDNDKQPCQIWTRKFTKTKEKKTLNNNTRSTSTSTPDCISSHMTSIFESDDKSDSESPLPECNGDFMERQCDDEGIPIVFIHGLGAGGATFFLNVHGLSEHLTVYIIDLPGTDDFNKGYRFFQE